MDFFCSIELEITRNLHLAVLRDELFKGDNIALKC